MSDNTFSLQNVFGMAAVALAIDLLFVFPISHSSMIGKAITAFSGSVVVPPLDWVATHFLGMENAGAALLGTGAAKGGAVTAGSAVTATTASGSMATGFFDIPPEVPSP